MNNSFTKLTFKFWLILNFTLAYIFYRINWVQNFGVISEFSLILFTYCAILFRILFKLSKGVGRVAYDLLLLWRHIKKSFDSELSQTAHIMIQGYNACER